MLLKQVTLKSFTNIYVRNQCQNLWQEDNKKNSQIKCPWMALIIPERKTKIGYTWPKISNKVRMVFYVHNLQNDLWLWDKIFFRNGFPWGLDLFPIIYMLWQSDNTLRWIFRNSCISFTLIQKTILRHIRKEQQSMYWN